MIFTVELVKTQCGYAAACLDLPGCASQGKTEDEALENLHKILDSRHIRKAEIVGTTVRRIATYVEDSPNLQQQRKQAEPFRVVPFDLQLPSDWISGKVDDLLDLLEKSDRHC